MGITPAQLEQYDRDGFMVLRDFVDDVSCNLLRTRAEHLVQEFDPQGVVSIFSTHEQNRISDDYFLESAGKIRFFSKNTPSTPTAP